MLEHMLSEDKSAVNPVELQSRSQVPISGVLVHLTSSLSRRIPCGRERCLSGLETRFRGDIELLARYLGKMQLEPIIRLRKSVGSTSRAAGSYKPR